MQLLHTMHPSTTELQVKEVQGVQKLVVFVCEVVVSLVIG